MTGTGKILLASEEVEYKIIRSSRRTIAIYVKAGGAVIVRAPWYVPAYVLKQFVLAKSLWIIRQREKLREVKSHNRQLNYTDGCRIPFLGEEFTLRVIENSYYNVAVHNNELHICGPALNSSPKINALTEGWYLSEAKKYLVSRTQELALLHKELLPQPKSVSVRKMKTRWGTCKSNGAILFNRELIKKERDIIDAVIVHELCHLVHHNHQKEFYSLLESIIPDYRIRRRELKKL